MLYFEFSNTVIERTIKELKQANRFIRIAMFQIHNKDIFEILQRKLYDGVAIEIITLPYDSINEVVRKQVIDQFESLKSSGAKIHFCKWNIGDPNRTSTAVGRWYSFHGKFIVTDKAAISLSANFTDQNEYDAILVYRDNAEKIYEFNLKFDELLNLFIRPNGKYDGNIRTKITETNITGIDDIFELPPSIQNETHRNHWITDYPESLCPKNIDISIDRLLVSPFDVRGRNVIYDLINEAEEFLYISTESFTDPEIVNQLIKKSLLNIDIKILTGSTSMDFTDRIQQMLRGLIAAGISIYTIEDKIHAKIIITDKRVTVSSINLNKMNLGFAKKSTLWRENTETLTICNNREIIESAKQQFEKIVDNSPNILSKLSERIENDVTNIFSNIYELKSKKEVKKIFSRFILHQEIYTKQTTLKIAEITSKLMTKFNRSLVTENDFLMALVLYYLSEKKQDIDDLSEKFTILSIEIDIRNILLQLVDLKLVENDNDYYKIRIASLI
ncbi:MAG TPA: hypothetical protein DCK95_08925 [Anaerolineaceae bacterium]|nr:hypothetical protein [Anaerolineaceae bacterium]